jgi:hypothetical protein
MPKRVVPFPLSKRSLRKFTGLGPRYEFLEMFAKRDFAFEWFDFNVKALDTTNLWTVAAGATATTWAVNASVGGWIRGASGTTAATSGLQIYRPNKFVKGDNGCGMIVGFRFDIFDEIRLEMGFADALPAVNTNVVNNISTPTFNTAADVALYMIDEASSVTTTGFYTDGTSITAAKTAVTAPVPVVDTLFTAMIQVQDNQAYLFLNDLDSPVASHANTDYIEGGNGLLPFFSQKTSDTNSKNIDIDFIGVWSGRLG